MKMIKSYLTFFILFSLFSLELCTRLMRASDWIIFLMYLRIVFLLKCNMSPLFHCSGLRILIGPAFSLWMGCQSDLGFNCDYRCFWCLFIIGNKAVLPWQWSAIMYKKHFYLCLLRNEKIFSVSGEYSVILCRYLYV